MIAEQDGGIREAAIVDINQPNLYFDMGKSSVK